MGERGPVVSVVREGLMDENTFELAFPGRITFLQVGKRGGNMTMYGGLSGDIVIFKTNDAIAKEMGPSSAMVSFCGTDLNVSPPLSILAPILLPSFLPTFDLSPVTV